MFWSRDHSHLFSRRVSNNFIQIPFHYSFYQTHYQHTIHSVVLVWNRKKFSRSSDDDSEHGNSPQKGERVDSITYYTDQLEMINNKVKNMQSEKKALAYSGDPSIRASQWISHMLGLAGDAAVTTLVRNECYLTLYFVFILNCFLTQSISIMDPTE